MNLNTLTESATGNIRHSFELVTLACAHCHCWFTKANLLTTSSAFCHSPSASNCLILTDLLSPGTFMANRISHDQNFKNLILDYPRDALTFFAPSQAPLPEDQVKFTPLRQEQLQQYPGTHYRELDVPHISLRLKFPLLRFQNQSRIYPTIGYA